MELKCPICKKTISVDPGSETFYCKTCNTSYSTARCYHQQFETKKTFLSLNGTLYSYHGDDRNITIPSQITRIAAGCFADNQIIESVALPSSVSVIEAHAFANCRNLVSVNLPDDLSYIGFGCFADCVKLPTIRVPGSTHIENSAFLRCSNLKASIYCPDSIKSASHIGLSSEQIEYRSSGQSSGGCYITSAVCERRGEADDCEMLTRFRAFRDNWLVNQPGGAEDVQEYYRTAPAIVDAIHSNERCNDILDGIYQNYLKPCFDLLDKGDYLSCRQVYTQMVRDCQFYFISSDNTQ